MKLLNCFLIFAVSICAVTCTGNETEPNIPGPDMSTDPNRPTSEPTLPPTKPSSTTPKPSSTTAKPSSTTPKPSPTTPKPSPPTPKPSPPTPEPPVTKPSTTSTTTTTSPKPTEPTKPTTPAPTPSTTTAPPSPSKPEVGDWNVTKPNSNITCIRAQMAIQIDVSCPVGNKTEEITVIVPKNATSNGNCDDTSEQFRLTWNANKNVQDIIQFHFMKNATTSEVSVDYINVILNGIDWSNGTDPMNFTYNKTEFEAVKNHSYKCDREQKLVLVPTKKSNCSLSLTVSGVHIQAFMNSTTNSFDEAIDCINSSTPDIVPIAVGCALAALVVVVLLAYLYGRRRSQARGYLSMIAETKKEEDYIPMKTFSCFK